MKSLLFLFTLLSWPAFGQIPDAGEFHYVLYDNGDRPVGTYFFTVQKDGILWRITSQMDIDTRFLLILQPGQFRKAVSLDPLTLEISEVESRGIQEESVDFQGRVRKLYVIEQKASDGDVMVKKFANGLIYRSQTSDRYAVLESAHTRLIRRGPRCARRVG